MGVTERLSGSKGVLHAPKVDVTTSISWGRNGFREGEQFALGHTAIWGWQQEEGGELIKSCLFIQNLVLRK